MRTSKTEAGEIRSSTVEERLKIYWNRVQALRERPFSRRESLPKMCRICHSGDRIKTRRISGKIPFFQEEIRSENFWPEGERIRQNLSTCRKGFRAIAHSNEHCLYQTGLRLFRCQKSEQETPSTILPPTSEQITRLLEFPMQQSIVANSSGGVFCGMEYGAPGVTRTPGQWFRKPLLCPPELRGQGRE